MEIGSLADDLEEDWREIKLPLTQRHFPSVATNDLSSTKHDTAVDAHFW